MPNIISWLSNYLLPLDCPILRQRSWARVIIQQVGYLPYTPKSYMILQALPAVITRYTIRNNSLPSTGVAPKQQLKGKKYHCLFPFISRHIKMLLSGLRFRKCILVLTLRRDQRILNKDHAKKTLCLPTILS